MALVLDTLETRIRFLPWASGAEKRDHPIDVQC